MKTYEIVIKPKSSFITPFHSDTFFGHICWAYRYRKGEDKLVELLKEINNGGTFLISSAFPVGYLPKPKLKPMTQDDRKALKEKYFNGNGLAAGLAAFETIKEVSKRRFIKEDVFANNINDLSERFMIEALLTNLDSQDEKKYIKEDYILKNTINRHTFTVNDEGGLYGFNEIFYDVNYRIFFRSNILDMETLKEVFEDISSYGFGKKKSTGKGYFSVESISEVELPKADNPNAFMTLSNYVPVKNEQIDGWYEIFTKFPKVGGEYSRIGNDGAEAVPFKNPLIMLAPGSILKYQEANDTYGGLIMNIYPPNPDVVQYAFAFPLGVRVRE